MKKSVVKFIKTCVRGGVLALSSLLVFSCGEDSGLGASVDTEAPKIEITYPPLAACIRDTFKLAGTCDDDKNVSKILITVTDTNTKEPVDTVMATIDPDGKKWQADINPFDSESQKYKYSDGNYQFTAEAHDGAGHKTSASRSFDLDNSAPVFVVSNPGVIKSQGKKASAYGSRFTIDGTIADDHTIASLTAKIVDENGTLVGEYKEEDIATAGGTSVVIAEHYFNRGDQAAKTTQNNRYDEIYGTDDAAGTKKFYCTVLVEDSTKQYKDPSETENTTSGNVSSKLWLNDSVYKSLISSKLGLGLSVADFMTILNGSYPDSTKASQALEILNSSVIDTGNENGDDKDASKLSFSLNPQANPTYNVNGFAPSEDSEGNAVYIEASSGNTVSVTISAGLDGTAILPGKVKVWTVLVDGLDDTQKFAKIQKVADLANKAQKPYASVAEINEHAQEIKAAVESQFAEKEVILVCDNSGDDGSSVTMTNISGMLPKDAYTSGRIYAFVVTGCDEDDVEFSHNSLYAFKASEAGVAPTLTIDSPDNNAYVKSTAAADLTITGTAKMPDGVTIKVDSVVVELTVSDENDGNKQVGSYTVKCGLNEDGSTYSTRLLTAKDEDGNETYSDTTNDSITYDADSGEWSFVPEKIPGFSNDATEGAGKSYFFVANVTATSTTNQYITKPHSIHVDTKKPVASISNVTPYVDGADFYNQKGNDIRNYVNGDIEVKFNIEETNLKEVFYKVSVGGEEKVAKTSLGRQFSGSISLDTTLWTTSETEQKELVVTISAEDTCGNEGLITTTEYNKIVYKDIAGENNSFTTPIIICQATDKPQIKFGNAEYSYTDNGVPKSLLASDSANADNVVYGHNLFSFDSNKINITLSDDDGLASATVTIWDKAGSLVEVNKWKTKDNDGKWVDDPEKKENPEIKTLTTASYTWPFVLPREEGIFKVQVSVQDSKLRSTPEGTAAKLWRKNESEIFFIAIDNGAPTVEIEKPGKNSFQPTKFAANGTVAEKDNVTLSRSIYRVDTDELVSGSTKDITEKIGDLVSDKYPWSELKTDMKTLDTDGDYRIEYTATDRFNQTSTASVQFIVDTKPPVFNDTVSSVYVDANKKTETTTINKVGSVWFNSTALNLEGEFTEKNGIDSIYYWLDKSVEKNDGATDFSKASGSFNASTDIKTSKSTYKTTISGFTERADAHKLILVAVDLAGNESAQTEYPSIKIDCQPPKFEKACYFMPGVSGEATGELLTNGKEDITLYGLISDKASGVKQLSLCLTDRNNETTTIVAADKITYTTRALPENPTSDELKAWYTANSTDNTTTYAALPTDTTTVTAWKAVISKDTLSASGFEGGEVKAKYSDQAGNETSNLFMFNLNVDKTDPVLANYSLTDTTSNYTAYYDKANDVYYVNNDSSHKFTLFGVATDNRGVAAVGYKIGTEDVTTVNTTGDFTFTDLDLSLLDGGTDSYITLYITDKAANQITKKIKITPDVKAPDGIHNTDSADKDLEFRIGEQEYNGVKVGAKYSAGTYGNATSIMIRGYFNETGSGLSMIYYWLTQTIPSDAEINGDTGFLKNYKDKATGYFAPEKTKVTQTILKNVGTGESATSEEKTVDYNFKSLLSGFMEGNNYLVLVAVDNVGNAAVDTKTFSYKENPSDETGKTVNCYSINVDTVLPELGTDTKAEIESTEQENLSEILTNLEHGDITFTGTASDAASGIDSIVLSVKLNSSTTKTYTATWSEAEKNSATKHWTAKVEASWFKDANIKTGTFPVYLTVKDKAGEGNSINPSIGSIKIDTENPKVSLSEEGLDADSVTSGIQVNGIIDLKGTIKDNNLLPDNAITEFQYALKTTATLSDTDDTGWTTVSAADMTGFALSGTNPFNVEKFDTSKLTDKKAYYLRAKATDEAGNIGYSPKLEVTVDQDTDRPIIKVTSMDEPGAIISAGTIQGTISDDDGITSFKYTDGTGTEKPIEVTSGSWRIDGLAAGAHSIIFIVEDSAGTTFKTEKTTKDSFASSGEPYISFVKKEKDKSSSAIGLNVDLSDPVFVDDSLKFASTKANEIPSETDSWGSSGNVSYGPSSKYMSVTFEVDEDVAMADPGSDVEIKTSKGLISLGDPSGSGYKVTRTPPAASSTIYEYKIGPIDTSTDEFQALVVDGNNTVTIFVTDMSGRKSSATFNIFVDNAAPTVKSFYNDTATGITGKVTIPGSVTDSTGIKTVKYLIPNTEARALSDKLLSNDAASASAAYAWKDITPASSMYAEISLDFTSSSFTEDDGTSLIYYAAKESSTAGKLEYAVTRSGTAGAYTYAQAAAGVNGKYPSELYVPVFFYTEDINGSKGISRFYYKVNPDGGIPTVELTSHAETKEEGLVKLVKTGNTVNLMGSASDDEEIKVVKITKLEYTTNVNMSESMPETGNWSTFDLTSANADQVVMKGTLDLGKIVCEGTTSWKASINTTEIAPDADGNGTVTGIRVTIVAYDTNDTPSSQTRLCALPDSLADYKLPCTHRVIVDKTVPILTAASIVGFTTSAEITTDKPVFEKSYQSGMYFSGAKAARWYLKVSMEDDSSITGFNISSQKGYDYIQAIDKISVDKDSPKVGTSQLAEKGCGNTDLGQKTFTVWIPVKVNYEGHVYATLEMLDGQHTDVTTAFSFFIDNTAPALYKTKAGTAGVADDKLAHADTLRLKSNGMQIDTGNNVVENSDGSYTFGDELVEERSGLAYVAFYFKKAASTYNATNRIYSPMFGTSNMATLAGDGKSDGDIYINAEGLPALVKTVTVTNTTISGVTTSTVTFDGLGSDKFINNKNWLPAGVTADDVSFGLVKIGGAYHKIKLITGDVATLADEVSSTYTEAEFIYAMLVDHQIAEGFSSADPTGVSNDDGDGLVEMVKQTGSTYKWTASIHSDNIPDGPAEIHIVAFDDAGNSNSGYVKTSIQNNRPRIARVYLATDLNGNGLFDFDNGAVPELDSNSERYTENGTEYGELAYYSTLTKESKVQAMATLKKNQCNFVVSNRLLVLPEIIGGNGTDAELRYAYSVSDNSPDALSPVDAEPENVGITKATETALKSFSSDLADLQLADRGSTTDSPVRTNISAFLDSKTPTDENGYFVKNGAVPTNNRGYLGFVLTNDDLKDHESWVGDTKIKKYFAFTIWDKTPETTQGEDSLYAILKLPLVINVKDDVRPEADITPFYWHSKEDGSFVYAEDGTPEGHIDLVAEADKNKTTVRPGVSGTVYIEGTAYDETRLSKIEVKDPSGTAYTIAEYDSGAWKTAENATEAGTNGWSWPDNYISSKVETITEPSQKGHKVAWKLEINMTKFGIKTNQIVDVTAYDASEETEGGNRNIVSTVQTVYNNHTSRYKMDFVPYIKTIYPATETSAARSRLGKFPVQAGKDMYIEGMNFSTGLEYWIGFSTTPENEALISSPNTYEGKFIEDDDVTKVENGKIKVTAPQNSCYVRVWVKPADGDWTYTKNNMNENAGCNIEDGYVPSDDNGKGNRDRGLKRANDAGTNFWTDDRYIAVWNNTALAGSTVPWDGKVVQIDSKDLKDSTYYKNKSGNGIDPVTGAVNTWSATWSSPDMIMYTTMGNGGCSKYRTMWDHSEAAFTFPVREMDWAIIGGKNWYVVRDDYVGNSSANVWGPGLFLGREGFDFPKSTWNSTNQPSDSEAYNIIERQGKDQPARTRAPATGYDSLQEQFQNLHITGWYDGTSHSYNNGNGNQTAPGYTYIYVSYYDSFAKCLKYAAYKEDWSNAGTGSSTKWGTENGSKNLTPLARAADNMTAETVVVAGVDRLFSASATDFTKENGADCGLYNDIMIDPSDHYPVIIYYNKTAGTLEVAHGKQTAPVTANYKAAAGAFTDTTEDGTGWSKTKGITPNAKHDFGRFVSATMDAKGNIHATAQDFTNGSLYYIFLKKSGTTYTPTYIHIDAVSSNSTWTDIRLDSDASTNTKWYQFKPVISYIDESKKLPKVAYVDSVDTVNETATFEAMPDAKAYEAASMKTNVLSSVYESTTAGTKSKVGISFNSDMLALDFLRGE